jgi:hypothetical protein
MKKIGIIFLEDFYNLLLILKRIKDLNEKIVLFCREDTYHSVQAINLSLSNITFELLNINDIEKLNKLNLETLKKERYSKYQFSYLYNFSYTYASFKLNSILQADSRLGPSIQNDKITDSNHFGEFYLSNKKNYTITPYSFDYLLDYYIEKSESELEKSKNLSSITINLAVDSEYLDINGWVDFILLQAKNGTKINILFKDQYVKSLLVDSDLLIEYLSSINFYTGETIGSIPELHGQTSVYFTYSIRDTSLAYFFNIPTVCISNQLDSVYQYYILDSNVVYLFKGKDQVQRECVLNSHILLLSMKELVKIKFRPNKTLLQSLNKKFGIYSTTSEKPSHFQRVFGYPFSTDELAFKINHVLFDYYLFDLNRNFSIDTHLTRSTINTTRNYLEAAKLVQQMFLHIGLLLEKNLKGEKQFSDTVAKINELHGIMVELTKKYTFLSNLYNNYLDKLQKANEGNCASIQKILLVNINEFMSLLAAQIELIESTLEHQGPAPAAATSI